jgi:hypothetical protein
MASGEQYKRHVVASDPAYLQAGANFQTQWAVSYRSPMPPVQ